MSENNKVEMSLSEISLRKLLKNLGVSSHQLINKQILSKISDGSLKFNQELNINVELTIKELDLKHTISSTIVVPDKNG